ncbi:hypothetical protein BT96DRAFT_1092984, partial [Gymnopus androsaceus JB14]
LLAVSRRNTNATEALIFLNKLKEVLIEYFKALEEESVRDNFVVIYELMDEWTSGILKQPRARFYKSI